MATIELETNQMLILTNCLTETVDEGCIKVANTLIGKMKAADPQATVVSFERRSHLTDLYLTLNKFLLNAKLASVLKKTQGVVLYVPFPAKPISTVIRILSVALMARRRIHVLLTMTEELNTLETCLLKLSNAKIMVLSRESEKMFGNKIGKERVRYLKTGIDTEKFSPVSAENAARLKEKYGLDPARKVILHVGHLNEGRNIAELMKLDPRHQVVLVTSTLTKNEQDQELRQRLQHCPNILILDHYLPEIQELYQMSDVYFFPVVERGHCIDVPLSCLEAAACNKPIVTTDYGEMSAFMGEQGFWHIDSFEPDRLNALIEDAIHTEACATRSFVLDYEWEKAVSYLLRLD